MNTIDSGVHLHARSEPIDPAPCARKDLSAETARLYAGDWTIFVTWCRDSGVPSLPATAATVAAHLTAATVRLGPGVLARRVAAIAHQHRQRGFAAPTADPAVKTVLRDARRAAVPRRQAAPSPAQMERMAASCLGDLAGLRDRALLLLMAAGRLGRATVVGLDAEHLRLTSTGADLSTTTNDAPLLQLARTSDHARCPVRALEDWMRVSETRFGPVFRKVDRWGGVEHRRLGADAVRRILDRRTPRRRRSGKPADAGPNAAA